MKEKWMRYAGKGFTIYLAVTGLASLVSWLILVPGDNILATMHLQWRNWVNMTFGVLWLSSRLLFLAGISVLLLQKTKGSWKVRLPVTIIAVALMIGVLIQSPGIPLILFGNTPESVVEWNGQTCVMSEMVWLDKIYNWYAYHGWFVMGRESLHDEVITPMRNAMV